MTVSHTPRELLLNALNHRYSGRFPSDLWIRPKPEHAHIQYYGARDFEEVQAILGITRIQKIKVACSNPEWESRTDLQTLTGESPLAGGRYLLHDERTYEDESGIVRRVGSDGKYDEKCTRLSTAMTKTAAWC
jgi:hypothetical protein